MSLADELLADLEDVGEEAVEQAEEEDAAADVTDIIEDVTMETDTSQSVKSIAKLLHSEEVLSLWNSVFHFFVLFHLGIYQSVKLKCIGAEMTKYCP